jgi:hypothetical protein
MFELEVDGIDGWVPVRLDLPRDALLADLRDRLPDHDPATWELLANLAGRNAASMQEGGTPLLAVWARLTGRDQVVPDTLATLSLVPTDPDPTLGSVTAALLGESHLYRPVVYTALDTGAGPATGLEAITLTSGDDGDSFLGVYAVVWVRATEREALVLSATTVDLVAGAGWCSELFQLAQGLRGY